MQTLALLLLLPLACLAQSQATFHGGQVEAAGGAHRLTLTATPGYWPATLRRPAVAKPVAGADSPHQAVALLPNLPNPFNPATTLRYTLPERALVRLAIYNVLGQQVRRLVGQEQESGYHTQVWDGLDQAGLPAASGVYFCRLQAGEQYRLVRMLLAK